MEQNILWTKHWNKIVNPKKENPKERKGKPMKKLTLFVFVLGMLSTLSLSAADSRLSGSVDFDYYSHYIWRGQSVSDTPSFQPGAAISIADVGPGSLSLSYWGSSFLADTHADGSNFAENDYTGSYAFDAGPVAVEVGIIYYTFPQGTGDGFSTTEVYTSLGYTLMESDGTSIGLSLGAYYDVDLAKEGLYLNLGVGAEFALTKDITGGVSIGVGYSNDEYSNFYLAEDSSGLNDLAVEASVGMPLTETFSLSAAIGYIDFLDSDLEVDGFTADSELYAKVGISASF